MPVAVWPSSLPYRPLRTAYDMPQRYAPAMTTEFEDGPARQRASSSAIWTQLAYQLRLTPDEWEIADAFVVTTLVQGTARFTMPVGRPYAPDPWPTKLVYLEKGTWSSKPIGSAPMHMVAVFTLNVLDW